MARLTELYVEKKALDFLKNRYAEKHQVTPYAMGQERLKRHRSGKVKIPDGLIAFRPKGECRVYTVIMEAKSQKRYTDLLTRAQAVPYFVITIVGFVLTYLLMSLFLQHAAPWLRVALSILSGGILSYVILGYLAYSQRFDTTKAIKQMKAYYADEKWLALPVDLYNKRVRKQDRFFEIKAQQAGFGILLISAGAAPRIIQEPRPAKVRDKEGYLRFYVEKAAIADWLSQQDGAKNHEPVPGAILDNKAPGRAVPNNRAVTPKKALPIREIIVETSARQAACIFSGCKDKVYKDSMCWEHYQDEHYRVK